MVKAGKMTAAAAVAALAVALTASADADARRIEDLLSRMTLEEKVGQLCERVTRDPMISEGGDMDGRSFNEAVCDYIRRGEIGSFVGVPGLADYNLYQKAAVEGSRLGIPLMFGRGCVHGCHVVFPIPLAQSCAWEPALVRRTADFAAREMLAEGVNWVYGPMLDLARDARWGRIAESPGQDPYLASLLAAETVRGFQGDVSSRGRCRFAACAKHFVAYGAGEGGRDYNGAELGEDTLRDVYLPPFAAAVAAGVKTVMPAFSSLNGVPCTVNRWLLRDILRGELGFGGFTVSDWNAIGECGAGHHGVTDGDVDAASRALAAGVDVDMLSTAYAKGLAEAVRRGRVATSVLDDAVRNVLRVKTALGLFEDPYRDPVRAAALADRAEGLRLAHEAAAKCCVLLKNEKGVLPLGPGTTVALGGPLADAPLEMYGCWTIHTDVATNQSLRAGLSAAGVKTVPFESDAVPAADVIVLALGEKGDESGENTSRTDLTLPADQRALLAAAKRTGKPVAVVLFAGRPLAVPDLNRDADAVLLGWQLGSAAGWGLADVLTGVAEPYGRLTVDFPQTAGQCPLYYNRLMTGRPNEGDGFRQPSERWLTRYTDVPLKAVWPFGFGLAYTRFRYSDERAQVGTDEVIFSATVANVGARSGSEVVQVYVRDCVAETARPRRELKGFARVFLRPGESRRVEIAVPRTRFAYHAGGRIVPGEGAFRAWIAPDSDSGSEIGFDIMEPKGKGDQR